MKCIFSADDPPGSIFIFENFHKNPGETKWKVSHKKDYDGEWSIEETYPPQCGKNEMALTQKSRNRKHAISYQFPRPYYSSNKTFVLQYEFRAQHSFTCSGAYIKLFDEKNFEPEKMDNETSWAIMFGPDRCGTKQIVQLIFRFYNPILKRFQERSIKNPPKFQFDYFTHLFTLVIRTDNTFSIFVDNTLIHNGNLLKDFDPPIAPPERYPDVNDKKPDNWVDLPVIIDPNSTKPDDWNESEPYMIPDPNSKSYHANCNENLEKFIPNHNSVRPKYWDESILGIWEPPLVPNPQYNKDCGKLYPQMQKNPRYKGKWYPNTIPNPNYKGEWKQRTIPNKYYYPVKKPYYLPPITGMGFEIWSVNRELAFSNILIGNDEEEILEWNSRDFLIRKQEQIKSYLVGTKHAEKSKRSNDQNL